MNEIIQIAERLEKFAIDRDWNQFHSPKNLSMALAVEAAELMQEFQWMTDEESKNVSSEKKLKIKEEIADVFNYLVRISSKLQIDIIAAANEKIIENGKKYPVEKAKGNAKKYTEF